jgi:hypothetical protein
MKKEQDFKKPSGYKNISTSQMDKLKKHAKENKMTMNSKHIKDMMKFMEQGDSFNKAHKKAMEMDKKKKDTKKKSSY